MKLFFLFVMLSWLLGNPFLALIVLLVIFYVLDRRFLGITPSLLKPFRRRSRVAKLRRQLLLNPHDTPAKSELAHELIGMRKYAEARSQLADMEERMAHSAEYWSDLGQCELALGQLEAGERHMLQALDINPRVKFGMPYLLLGDAWAGKDDAKALMYLREFQGVHSSSCEAYYLLGKSYERMGDRGAAKQAYRECGAVYRTLPRYMKRRERRWALLSALRSR
ncbi:tetratricopeptide repeat protein [Cohnella sp. 56]|uniref:tetratricopeptide repeat protein n=1 Tax=Cohnella sp. 56 TaxID=3113722 RepID=UPI0030E956F2